MVQWKLKSNCGSEFNSASTTTLVKSTRSMPPFFGYRKWPSEALNLQNFPLRGLCKGCALSGARNIFIALGAARKECHFFTKTGSKVPFSQVFAALHPLYGRAGPLTPKNLHGVTPGPGVREHGFEGVWLGLGRWRERAGAPQLSEDARRCRSTWALSLIHI